MPRLIRGRHAHRTREEEDDAPCCGGECATIIFFLNRFGTVHGSFARVLFTVAW
ncbi:hypothetical protein PVAP13_9KG228776 [Panicum virgatum]|uniref:Uncharacterized protein n=1 Tax=Panicum virgatum TaxID=38727 RepID=A0A8T0N9R4_PANVG|nr:hypothetical protein PVAP13_9KG228776 [Panicum virgatum]